MTHSFPTLLPLLVLGAPAAGQAPPPTVIPTRNTREITGTGGAYLGYTDELESDGRFELRPSPGGVQVDARYSWRWSSSEGDRQSGREERVVTVDADSRRYRDRCDLDDMDGLPPGELATWLWVPTGLQEGQVVQILDEQARVEGVETIVEADQTWQAVRLSATGTGRRDDDYGQLTTTWSETWWYDSQTGTFLRSQYDERAEGTVEGAQGDFVLQELVRRMPADHRGLLDEAGGRTPAEETTGTTGPGDGDILSSCCCLGNLAGIPLIGGLALRRRALRKPRDTVKVAGLGTVALVEVRQPAELRGQRFGEDHALSLVLADLACRTLATGGRVQVARVEGRLVGLAMAEATPMPLPATPAGTAPTGQAPTQRVGTVIAPQGRLAQALVYNLGLQTWFALHPSKITSPDSFRVVESWSVLALDFPQPQRWDPGLVRRMKDSDRAAVVALLEAEGDAGMDAWLQAQLADGDQGFVAVVQGRIVGAALCGLHGEVGRLHGLVVHPDHRGQGLGAELLRARLDALALLGAMRVVVEIATANLASMHLAREAGFQPVGSLVVESRLPTVRPGQVGRR
ncbi:GNAT family N-acetyltransferase [Myxococcota bacterium]|nr:GNAT family N-acetyltransferase [Myxococcota bacterium]